MERWSTFNLENNLKSGFRATDIFPYNPAVIARPLELLPVAKKPEPLPLRLIDVYPSQPAGI